MAQAPGRLTLTEDDRRLLAVWAADCAGRVLPCFESRAPDDPRPRDAIDGVRSFARGELGIGPVRALSAAAHAAARSVSDPAAVAAARAAGHAAGTAHMAAHARGVPAYATIAVRRSDGDGAAAEEQGWQLAQAGDDVREALRKLPAPPAGGGELGALIRDLHGSIGAGSERDAPPDATPSGIFRR